MDGNGSKVRFSVWGKAVEGRIGVSVYFLLSLQPVIFVVPADFWPFAEKSAGKVMFYRAAQSPFAKEGGKTG